MRRQRFFSPERRSKVIKFAKNDPLDALIVLARDEPFLFFPLKTIQRGDHWRIFLQSNPTILIVFHLFLACFQLNMIIPPQQINIYVLPHKSGSVQVLRQQISPNLAIALARPVFELQKCYLDENCSEFNQKSIAVLRTWLACLVQKLR